jgi:Dolichyl-phosphate-mannose-protein mannosyltransferase
MPLPQYVTGGPALVSATLFALFFLWLALALGRRASLWLGLSPDEPIIERGIVALALGVGVLECLALTLAGAGAFSVRSIRIAMSVVTLASVPDLWAVARRLLSTVKGRGPIPGWLMLWCIALVPGLLVAYVLAVTPALDADGLGYHLTVVKAWLASGTLAFLPTYTYSNMPMGMELIFAIAMSFTGDTGAKLLHFCLGVAGAVGIYLAGKRLYDQVAGAAAATLFLFGPFGVGGILGWAYVEGAVSFLVIASTLAWLMWFDTRRASWLRAAFAAAGVAVSFKITAALFPLGLLLLTWFIEWQEERSRRSWVSIAIKSWPLILLAAIPITPWLLRATVVTGNPIFPMFGTVIPSRDFPPALSAEWDLYFRYLNWGTGAGGLSLETRKRIIVAALVAIVALSGVLFAFLRSSFARATVVVVGAMMVLQVLAVGLYKRHWFSVMSVVQLLAVALVARMLPGRWQRSAVVAATVVLSLASARANLKTVDNDVTGVVRTALGLESQRDFLARHLPLYTLYEYANRNLPADSGVAFEYGCGGFHIDRKTFCLEIPQGSLSVESWNAFVTDARRLGLTHVIAPRVMANGSLPNFPGLVRSGVGFTFKERTDQIVLRLLTTRGKLLASAADQGLFAVDLKSAE